MNNKKSVRLYATHSKIDGLRKPLNNKYAGRTSRYTREDILHSSHYSVRKVPKFSIFKSESKRFVINNILPFFQMTLQRYGFFLNYANILLNYLTIYYLTIVFSCPLMNHNVLKNSIVILYCRLYCMLIVC